MKVAIVHDFLVRYWWAEKLVQCFAAMFPQASIYTLFYNEKKMWDFFKWKKIITSSLQKIYNFFWWSYVFLLPFMPKAIEEFDFSEYDLVISSSSAFSHWIITDTKTKHISYVHSPMRWAWDYYFKFQEERGFWIFMKAIFTFIIHKIRIWDFIAKDRADKIIAASGLIKNRIKKFWQKDSVVIYPFVDDVFQPIENPTKDYYLVVSQLVPYKKVDQIIEAFNVFWKKLIIVWTWCEEEKLKKIAKWNIEFLWAKYWDELLKFYQNAKAFIFASIDDFGITPLESMACWVPVIAFAWGWVLETVIDWKTWFFYHDQTSLALLECLKKVNLDSIKKEDCVDRAGEFGKERFKDQILWQVKIMCH